MQGSKRVVYTFCSGDVDCLQHATRRLPWTAHAGAACGRRFLLFFSVVHSSFRHHNCSDLCRAAQVIVNDAGAPATLTRADGDGFRLVSFSIANPTSPAGVRVTVSCAPALFPDQARALNPNP